MLVAQARDHEVAGDQGVAFSRYQEAIELDARCEEAYLGLGALRARAGSLAEAERVYTAALASLPASGAVALARASLRTALRDEGGAIADLARAADAPLASEALRVEALRRLAEQHAQSGALLASLAAWRRLLAMAAVSRDARLEHEARGHVRALLALVGALDPVASPATRSVFRLRVARAAR